MDKSKYDRYVVYVPKKSAPDAPFPSLTMMCNELVPESNIEVMYNWVLEKPEIKPEMPLSHAHDYDEIIMNIGSNPHNPEDLGCEVVGFLGNDRHTLSNTSAIFIPRNVEHGMVSVSKFRQPYMHMAIKLNAK